MGNRADKGFATRRGLLLDRFAWGAMSLALILALFLDDPQKWIFVGGIALLAVVSWLLSSAFEKKAKRKTRRPVDEHGNAKKTIL